MWHALSVRCSFDRSTVNHSLFLYRFASVGVMKDAYRSLCLITLIIGTTPKNVSLQTCVQWLQHALNFVGLADATIVDGATRDLDLLFGAWSIGRDPRNLLHPSHHSGNSPLLEA